MNAWKNCLDLLKPDGLTYRSHARAGALINEQVTTYLIDISPSDKGPFFWSRMLTGVVQLISSARLPVLANLHVEITGGGLN
jgi:hypothetical protein